MVDQTETPTKLPEWFLCTTRLITTASRKQSSQIASSRVLWGTKWYKHFLPVQGFKRPHQFRLFLAPGKEPGPFLRSLKCLVLRTQQLFVKWTNGWFLGSSTVQYVGSSPVPRAWTSPRRWWRPSGQAVETWWLERWDRAINGASTTPTGIGITFYHHLLTKKNTQSQSLAHQGWGFPTDFT